LDLSEIVLVLKIRFFLFLKKRFSVNKKLSMGITVSQNKIQLGDYILIMHGRRKRWLVKVEENKEFHTHIGIINIGKMVGKPYGSSIKTSKDKQCWIFQPVPFDYVHKFRRPTQVMYPKDIGLVLMMTGIGPGSRVVEAGTGSGALTSVLAYYVRPNGKIFTYEFREDFFEISRENIAKANVYDYVIQHSQDVMDGIVEKNVDAVVIDLDTPWLVVQTAKQALKDGGYFVSFSPTFNQIEKTVSKLDEEDFKDIQTIECFSREIKTKEGATRPNKFISHHTGYLTFARKTSAQLII
jgi:tRNA (adenine57-N1/adenine58-N1)-methyltransferase